MAIIHRITYGGTASFRNAILNLEPDNPDSYETSTEEYIDIDRYTGPRGNQLTREVT